VGYTLIWIGLLESELPVSNQGGGISYILRDAGAENNSFDVPFEFQISLSLSGGSTGD
jgi:hypothetical protein